MPEFVNPFSGQVPERKLSLRDLVRAIRLDVAAEEEATHLYTAQADATDNALAKKVLEDIANEERVHVGEFQRLIQILTGDEDKWLADGATEVNEMAEDVNAPPPSQAKTASPGGEEPTIGSMKQ
jgi:rubrerythrin